MEEQTRPAVAAHADPAQGMQLGAAELAAELTARGVDVGTVLAAGRILLEQLPQEQALLQVMQFVGMPASLGDTAAGQLPQVPWQHGQEA